MRGTELARMAQDGFLLWHNLDHLGRTYEALLDLKAACRVYEEALELGHVWGRNTRRFPLPAWAPWRPSPKIGRRLTPMSGEHTKQVPPSMCLTDSTSITRSRRCCVEGTSDALEKWSDVSPNRPRTNGRKRKANLRSMAVLSEFEGDTQRAICRLHEALTLAEKIGLPKELWQIQSRIGDLCERRGEIGRRGRRSPGRRRP